MKTQNKTQRYFYTLRDAKEMKERYFFKFWRVHGVVPCSYPDVMWNCINTNSENGFWFNLQVRFAFALHKHTWASSISIDGGGVRKGFPPWEASSCSTDVLLNMWGLASRSRPVHCPTGTVTATLSRSIIMIGRLCHISILMILPFFTSSPV